MSSPAKAQTVVTMSRFINNGFQVPVDLGVRVSPRFLLVDDYLRPRHSDAWEFDGAVWCLTGHHTFNNIPSHNRFVGQVGLVW